MRKRNKYCYFIPAVMLAVGILIASLLETGEIPYSSLSDKTMHVWAYAVLAIAMVYPLIRLYKHRWRHYLIAWIVCCAYGAMMELLQSCCTATRVGEWLDIVANGIGTTVGLVFNYFVYYIWRHLRTNTK